MRCHFHGICGPHVDISQVVFRLYWVFQSEWQSEFGGRLIRQIKCGVLFGITIDLQRQSRQSIAIWKIKLLMIWILTLYTENRKKWYELFPWDNILFFGDSARSHLMDWILDFVLILYPGAPAAISITPLIWKEWSRYVGTLGWLLEYTIKISSLTCSLIW